MKFRPNHSQYGFTLVEMVVTISTASVLLAMATGVVHRMMRFESQSRQRADVHRTAVRLTNDFRKDVHQAHSIEIGDEAETPNLIRLMFPAGNEVTYLMVNHTVMREQLLDEHSVYRETYEFPIRYQVRFSDRGPQLAGLAVVHNLQLIGIEPQTVVHVEAEVGRLLRLTESLEAAP